MDIQNPLHERIWKLEQALQRVSRTRAGLGDKGYRDLVAYALGCQRDVVSRWMTPGTRVRVGFGRPAARHFDTGVLIVIGKPACRGIIDDSDIGRECQMEPWFKERTFINDHVTQTPDEQGIRVLTERDVIEDRNLDRDIPDWCTVDRIASAWKPLLERARDPDSDVVLEHTTTLATLAAVRMVKNNDFGYVEWDPALGRDGRVSLPDVYSGIPVSAHYVPEDRLLYSLDTVRDLAEQNGAYNPHNPHRELEDPERPTNGYHSAD